MVDPINYGAMLTQIDLSPLQRGLAIRDQRREQQAQTAVQEQRVQLAQQQFTQQQADDLDYRTALSEYAKAPTSQRLLELSARFPSHAEALSAGFKTYTVAQQQDIIGSATSALGYLAQGNTAGAKAVLEKRQQALKNSGVDTTETDAAIALAGSDDPVKRRQGMALLTTVLSGAIGADATSGIMKTFGLDAAADERRTDNERADRNAALAERRTANAERATNAAIAGRARDDARADRKAAGGGGKRGAYSDAQLDALLR